MDANLIISCNLNRHVSHFFWGSISIRVSPYHQMPVCAVAFYCHVEIKTIVHWMELASELTMRLLQPLNPSAIFPAG
jgi:hypothetical protein